ncbi:MAG: transglycosylase domain-containing protein [Bacteriovoracia bacterium]
MAPHSFKRFLLPLLFGTLGVVLLTPLYMYFSHDVKVLRVHYPHMHKEKKDISFEIRPGKPEIWVPVNRISKFAKWAIILSEDWSFYQHQGIDVAQIREALLDMVEDGKFRGASTITQQMVKNVFLSEERTIWRKVHEMILANKVENALKKDRILEIYLNVIEFGPDIYGIKKASWHYFKKHPSALNAKEGAFLAMLLPSPKRYYVSYSKKELTKFARVRINEILLKMKMAKVLTESQYEDYKKNKLSWEN